MGSKYIALRLYCLKQMGKKLRVQPSSLLDFLKVPLWLDWAFQPVNHIMTHFKFIREYQVLVLKTYNMNNALSALTLLHYLVNANLSLLDMGHWTPCYLKLYGYDLWCRALKYRIMKWWKIFFKHPLQNTFHFVSRKRLIIQHRNFSYLSKNVL